MGRNRKIMYQNVGIIISVHSAVILVHSGSKTKIMTLLSTKKLYKVETSSKIQIIIDLTVIAQDYMNNSG